MEKNNPLSLVQSMKWSCHLKNRTPQKQGAQNGVNLKNIRSNFTYPPKKLQKTFSQTDATKFEGLFFYENSFHTNREITLSFIYSLFLHLLCIMSYHHMGDHDSPLHPIVIITILTLVFFPFSQTPSRHQFTQIPADKCPAVYPCVFQCQILQTHLLLLCVFCSVFDYKGPFYFHFP